MAACDIKGEKRRLVLERFGISNFTTDYRKIVESDEVDLVLVLTSMQEHGEITRAAIEAGKHVMVEKPLAMTLEEAQEIVAMARKSPRYLVCAPHVTLSPTYQAMWRRIHRGDIGKVLLARARYGWAGPSWGKWFYLPGGGVLFDLGVYNITSITGFLGPARRVMAMAGIAIPERVVDGELMRVQAEDNVHLLLDFGESVFAVVTTGFTIQRYRGPSIELYGTKGTIQMRGDDWDPDGYELWQNDVGAWQIYDELDPNWTWTDGLRHIVECIHRNARPIITPEHALHVLEIMLKAQESGRDGQAKQLETAFTPLALSDDLESKAVHLIHDRSHPREE